MTESVNLRLHGPLLQQARELAAITDSTLQEVLLDWLNFSLAEQPLESLTDAQLLQVCGLEMPSPQKEQFNALLMSKDLTSEQGEQLNKLRALYRLGLVRKAKATRLAVERGLTPPLIDSVD
jgi:hypothetical protein